MRVWGSYNRRENRWAVSGKHSVCSVPRALTIQDKSSRRFTRIGGINYFSMHVKPTLCFQIHLENSFLFLIGLSAPLHMMCGMHFFQEKENETRRNGNCVDLWAGVALYLIHSYFLKWHFKVITFKMKRWCTALSGNSLQPRSRDYTLICQSENKKHNKTTTYFFF